MVDMTSTHKIGGNEEGRAGVLVRYRTMVLPAGLIALGLALPSFMFSGRPPSHTTGLGPGAWPTMALDLMALFSVIWLISEWRLERLQGTGAPSVSSDEPYSMRKALTGIAIICAYGCALSHTGFGLTSAVFIAVWCVYGGIRNPLVIAPVSLIGTGVLLWVFMGLALMPLSRGQGIFDTFSIWLLQVLHIY